MAYHVLLINPWVHDFTAFDLWSKPLGLLYIASTLRYFGYEVHLIDCLHYDHPQKQKPYGTGSFYSGVIEKPAVFKHIPRRFRRYGMTPEELLSRLRGLVGARRAVPLLVCVTSHMTYWYPGVFEAIKMVKAVFPSVPVALGGIYASLCNEHAREKSGADYVIKGLGELEVLKLADRLSDNERDYSQVMKYIEEGPLPAYDLYPRLNSVSLLTSRGCPFRCTYCASFLLGSRFLWRATEKVVAEIEYYITTLGVKDIAFYDDALLVDSTQHIIPILKLLIERGLHANYHTPNGLHPRYIDLSLARLLWRAGFKTLRLGFEGASARLQKASSFKVSSKELEKALECLRIAGYSTRDIGVYLLVGLPGQSIEEVVEAMELVNRLGARIKLAEYSPIPGTEEFQRASALCPQVAYEPLSHNKSTFAPVGMGIDYETFERLKSLAKRLNAELDAGAVRLRWVVAQSDRAGARSAPTTTMES